MTKFKFNVDNTAWKVRCGSMLPKIFGASGLTLGSTTYFRSNICPNAQSLAHEWYHVKTTSAIRYALSYTIGKLWKDSYWRVNEIGANFYAMMHKDDPIFMISAATIRRHLPTEWPTVTITHKV